MTLKALRQVAMICIPLLLTGCATGAGPAPVSVPPVSTPAAPESGPSPAEAQRLAKEGRWQEAAQLWEAIATKSPTADAWNEAAYAWMQSGSPDKAVIAGEQALKLKPDHPYALYNVGIAQLKGGNACGAVVSLDRSASLQPDRWEPDLALAEALAKAGNGSASAERLQRAIGLGAPSDAVAPVQQLVTKVAAPPTAADLDQYGEKVGQAEGVAVYHWSNPGRPCKAGIVNEYWLVIAGQAHRLPPEAKWLEAVMLLTTLPGGDRVYLLRGGDSPVYVANASAYYLMRVRAGAPELLRSAFAAKSLGPVGHLGQLAATDDRTFYSHGSPVLLGETDLATEHYNPASGRSIIHVSWKVDWALGLVRAVSVTEESGDPNK